MSFFCFWALAEVKIALFLASFFNFQTCISAAKNRVSSKVNSPPVHTHVLVLRCTNGERVVIVRYWYCIGLILNLNCGNIVLDLLSKVMYPETGHAKISFVQVLSLLRILETYSTLRYLVFVLLFDGGYPSKI